MRILFVLIMLFCGTIFIGCTADTKGQQDIIEEQICTPNTTQECLCPEDQTGFQTCSDDGSNWEDCVCSEVQDDVVEEVVSDIQTDTLQDFDTVRDTTIESDTIQDSAIDSEGTQDTEDTTVEPDRVEEHEIVDTSQEAGCDVEDGICCVYSESNNSSQACYLGPEGTVGVGVCRYGTQECLPSGVWDNCVNYVGPEDEMCSNSGTDNDCDGNSEDVDGSGEECSTGASGICSSGLMECVGSNLLCVAVNEPGEETCANEGSDDDCDRIMDNIPQHHHLCSTDLPGVCSTGQKECVDEVLSCVPDTEPDSLTEECDGLDNDCDGEEDEDFDFLSDLEHCGACGVRCVFLEDCVYGRCHLPCGVGFCVSGESCDNEECCSDGKCFSPMIPILGGPFMMGCNTSIDDNCNNDETPYHEVNVPMFEINLTEVTVGQYRTCVEDNGSCSEPSTSSERCNWGHSDREAHPVNCVDWYKAQTYCDWGGKRLCSESEWEKAARGTDGRIYPWDNEEATCERAVMKDGESGCGENRTWAVGSKPAGVYGVYDLAGNVWEWLEDDYHSSYDNVPSDGSAWVENPRASERVIRGGSFLDYASSLRTSNRHYIAPDDSGVNVGFRCCSDAP